MAQGIQNVKFPKDMQNANVVLNETPSYRQILDNDTVSSSNETFLRTQELPLLLLKQEALCGYC